VTARVGRSKISAEMLVSGVGWLIASIRSPVSIGGQMMDSMVERTIAIRTVAKTKNQYSRLDAVPLNFLKFTKADFTASTKEIFI
jgi:hypothetical protein